MKNCIAQRFADEVVSRGIVPEITLAHSMKNNLNNAQLTQAIYPNRNPNSERSYHKYVSN